jgi:hypothetical protein
MRKTVARRSSTAASTGPGAWPFTYAVVGDSLAAECPSITNPAGAMPSINTLADAVSMGRSFNHQVREFEANREVLAIKRERWADEASGKGKR